MQIVRETPPAADSREDLRNERLFESVHDVVRFEQLLVTAEQLCLPEPPAYGEYLPPADSETKLIAEVGVRRWRLLTSKLFLMNNLTPARIYERAFSMEVILLTVCYNARQIYE